MAAGRFVRAAAELLRALGKEPCAVAGGVAVNAHGFIRGTRDVDVIVSIPLEEARRRLERHGIKARLFKGDPLEGDFPCLKGVIGARLAGGRVGGVPFDVLPQLVPLTREATIELDLRGETLRVVDLETLIRLKLKAGSVNDLYDIAILVHLQPAWKSRSQALAAHAPDLAARLAAMIEDPRVRAKAREVQRQDAALRDFEKRARRPRQGRIPPPR
jgi:hypothetical protein